MIVLGGGDHLLSSLGFILTVLGQPCRGQDDRALWSVQLLSMFICDKKCNGDAQRSN